MPKLIVFDVDGVLLDTDTGGFKLLAEAIGKGQDMRRLHQEYEKRKHAGPWGLEQLAQLFAGVSEHTMIAQSRAIVEKYLRPETTDVIKKLRERGHLIVAYSSNPLWILNVLREKYQLDDVCGNVLEVVNGIVTGKLLHKVDRYDKAKHLADYMEKNGLAKQDVVVIGDSVTDLPMSQHGTFYAFNTKDDAVKNAAQAVVHPPLTNLLIYI
ncbi:HAD family phosphatase [Candidatus Woesearchaeota archaeon]|nr:HAD family phosphatase [Candidatus Woesearchaeota archaeon]